MRLFLCGCAMLMTGFLTSAASAAITGYNQNFDGLTPGPTALSADGWEFFSDNAGLGAYNGPAPGAGPQISALADDGGPNQYINFFANYDNGGVHNNPPLQEAISLFRNQPFTSGDAALQETWYFNFDYAANPNAPVTSAITPTQVGAFIRVFDPAFNLLDTATFDTIGATAAFQGSPTLSVTMSNAYVNGGFIQFGFNNLVGSFEGSGRFYDNVRFANTAIPEPGSFALLSLGALGIVARRRRR